MKGLIFRSYNFEKRKKKFYDPISKELKKERVKYFKSILQPYRNGFLSREYIEAYGTKGIDVTQKEINEAKYVYKDLDGWSNRHKSL